MLQCSYPSYNVQVSLLKVSHFFVVRTFTIFLSGFYEMHGYCSWQSLYCAATHQNPNALLLSSCNLVPVDHPFSIREHPEMR